MKAIIFLSITLFLNELAMCQSNTSVIKNVDGNGFIIYVEKNWADFKGYPKDKNGKDIDIRDVSIETQERLKEFFSESFTDKTISKLKEIRWYVFFLISSNGDIVSVKMILREDTHIELNEINTFFTKIKEQLHFNILFDGKVEEEGYIVQSTSSTYLNE